MSGRVRARVRLCWLPVTIVLASLLCEGRALAEYEDPPEGLVRKIEDTLHDVGEDNDVETLHSTWDLIVAFVVADAVMNGEANISVMRVFRSQLELAETTRSDKQLGAASGATGSTSLVEKAGLARLLGLAVEYGAVQQTQNGSSVTLSTTPYALGLLVFGERDTAETYRRWKIAPRVSFAANFAIDSERTTAPGDVELDSVTTLSARYNFWGDRSTRSEAFQTAWEERVQPAIRERLMSIGSLLKTVYNKSEAKSQIAKVSNDVLDDVKEQLEQGDLSALARGDDSAAVKQATRQILDALWESIYVKIADGRIALGFEAEQQIREATERLERAVQGGTHARRGFEELIEAWNERPGGTATYNWQRVDGGSDYSQLQIVFQGDVRSFDVSFSASLSLNHDSSTAPGDNTVRDYGGALSIERSFGNLLFGGLDDRNQSPITGSLSGKLVRLEAPDDLMGLLQLRFNIPVFMGLELPLALTYASRTESVDESDVRFNIGLSLDSDKLAALARLGRR